ncbi:pinin-like protein [Cinnamomum micranthum f. kanehirae]|uniref:Pinin-like protein n=1 Tax=Cinnamomum micranthum f. kanehirae TaxID=337451 RepID=A0A3S4PGK3_9MAGN|nr:pinin-like protein [Cinnamomum micranthum f. kanehirae]
MASAAVEKTEEELRKEIEELHRQQWEITQRLRDPRGLRRGAAIASNGATTALPRQRGFVRPADRVDSEDQPAPKRRLSSAVVKVEDGELVEDANGAKDVKEQDSTVDVETIASDDNDNKLLNLQQHGGFRTDAKQRASRTVDDETQATVHVPRVLPKNEDPSLVDRNKRMLGRMLGTLAKFREEDKNLSTSEAFLRRSDSLRRAEQRAREESERLRQQEREQIAEKRRRDLTLRARVAAKAEEKKLELLFLQWSEHHKKLSNFLRTKAEPPIFYLPAKPLEADATLVEQRKMQVFEEWKVARREELSEYQKQIGEQYVSNVEAELERWQNARNARKANSLTNLQETMDKELETHRLEHGPKTRKIPGSNDDEEEVEDIAGEDDMMDDVLEVDDNRRVDEASQPETGNTSPNPDDDLQ